MQVNTQHMNVLSSKLNPFKQNDTVSHQAQNQSVEESTKLKELSALNEAVKTKQVTKDITADKLEMSSQEMTVKSDSTKINNEQNKVTEEQVAQSALKALEEQGKNLKELSSKHQEAKPEEKEALEKQAKDVLNTMNEIKEKATVNGKNVLEEKVDMAIPKDVEKVNIKDLLKLENVEKQIEQPIQESKQKVDKKVEELTASITASQQVSTTQAQVQSSLNKVKESLRPNDIQKVSSALDGRRQNVLHLLK